MSNIKIWAEKPTHEEVESYVKQFFQLLQSGHLDEAKGMVEHAYADWDDTIHVVWEDHYLVHERGPQDKSLEGMEWKKNLDWLKDLTIEDNFEWLKEDRVWVNFVYRGKPSGYIGEFAVVKGEDGYFVQRVIFQMA